ncbi:outer membrane beta-barrel protein [Endozoicomonas sp. ONNA2]|uniref:outer membrane beta-barrel protein n=1 Tax=Endozoicomonas sp. ONNA2 TaxID=2828741 RepID=UPI0027D2DC08|nr:outer membrane beta-barrel protein [Endozoicomonas sp. ONNA2]
MEYIGIPMKKITSLLIALTVSAVSSMAMAAGWEDDWPESDAFVGLEGGYAKTTVKVDGLSGDDKSDNTGFFGVRLGSFWQDEARAYLTVGYLKPKDAHWNSNGTDYKVHDIKQLNLLVSADYLFMPDWEIQPFVGLTIGATETKAEGSNIPVSVSNTADGSFEKKWSFAYGAQAGVIYQIDNIDLEAGLRYLTNSTSHHYKDHHNVKLEVNDSRQIYLAASIHF